MQAFSPRTPNLRICCDAAIMARENILVLCVNLAGWDGVGGGRWEGGLRGKGRMYACGWFMLMYSRN